MLKSVEQPAAAPAARLPGRPAEHLPAPPAASPPCDPADAPAAVREIGGPSGPEPTRYGDWEKKGRCIDF